MGRIKSLMVKKAAKQILADENTGKSFNSSFEHNKKLLARIMPSKPIKNKVAGYIARLVKMKQNPRVKKIKVQENFPIESYNRQFY